MKRSTRVDDETAKAIDAALASWRQGDVALDAHWFVYVAVPQQPLTDVAAQAEAQGPAALTAAVKGVVMLTQTCDLIRPCLDRPFVEVAPLVDVSAEHLAWIKRGRQPRYAFIPGLEAKHLVADLDRVMTVEKSIAATWTRIPGWTSDRQARELAQALVRKRARFAFPDAFTEFAQRFANRVLDKHGKLNPEGAALRVLREIRVTAAPSWDEASIDLMFWFIRDDALPPPPAIDWPKMLASWLALLQPARPLAPPYVLTCQSRCSGSRGVNLKICIVRRSREQKRPPQMGGAKSLANGHTGVRHLFLARPSNVISW